MKFTPVIGLKNLPAHKTFEAAFRAFHAAMTAKMETLKTVPVAWLNSCWIESTARPFPYFFDEVVAIGHERGWLKKGKIVPPRTRSKA